MNTEEIKKYNAQLLLLKNSGNFQVEKNIVRAEHQRLCDQGQATTRQELDNIHKKMECIAWIECHELFHKMSASVKDRYDNDDTKSDTMSDVKELIGESSD